VENRHKPEKTVESETMSGIAEKQMKYKRTRASGSDFEILDFTGTDTRKEISSISQNTKVQAREDFSKDSKIAVYESPYSAPRIIHITYYSDLKKYIEELSQKTHQLCQQFTFVFPYPIIKSLIENLIHADFTEPVISILNEGKMLRIADQGQGIINKSHALQVGFSTARTYHKTHIAGVGSGLPTVAYYADMSNGSLIIEDNINKGTVITLNLAPRQNKSSTPTNEQHPPSEQNNLYYDIQKLNQTTYPLSTKSLSERQQEVLVAVTDCGFIGPSQLAELFEISTATAYRDLQYLERQGYVHSDAGKRTITQEGLHYLETHIFGTSSY